MESVCAKYSSTEAFGDCLQAFYVFFLHAQVNDEIIQIDQTGQII